LNDRQAWVDQVSEELASRVPAGLGVLREDLGRNFRAVLQSAFTRLDLVTREEFDVQRAVLARLRTELAELAGQVAALEQREE
jgi:BMFP domain-containing protein YqiC